MALFPNAMALQSVRSHKATCLPKYKLCNALALNILALKNASLLEICVSMVLSLQYPGSQKSCHPGGSPTSWLSRTLGKAPKSWPKVPAQHGLGYLKLCFPMFASGSNASPEKRIQIQYIEIMLSLPSEADLNSRRRAIEPVSQ